MTQDNHDRFQFSFPVELVKAENEDEWRVRGVASTEHKDLQEEIVKQAGLDISALKSGQGLFNNDHQKGPENILGKVDYAQNTPNGLYIEGYLFKFQPRAQAYYNIMRSLKKGDKRRVQMSIEGKVLKRSENNEKIIARAKVEKIALTMDPVNAHTYAEIVKSLSVNKIELEECDDSIEGQELMKAEDGELLTYTTKEFSSPTKASVLRRPEKGLDASSVPSPAKKIKKAKQKDYIEISKAKAFVLLEMLEKGGKKYPIGTIRHGYQKVAEGKWAPYRPGGPKREAGTIEGVPKKEVKPLVHKPLAMLAPPTEEGDKQHLQKLDVPRDFGGKIHPDVSVHKDPEKAGNWMDTTSTGHRVIARQADREGSKDVAAFHNQKADEKEAKLRGLIGKKPEFKDKKPPSGEPPKGEEKASITKLDIKMQQNKIHKIDQEIDDLQSAVFSNKYSNKIDLIMDRLAKRQKDRDDSISKLNLMHKEMAKRIPKIEGKQHKLAAEHAGIEAAYKKTPENEKDLEFIQRHHETKGSLELSPKRHVMASNIFGNMAKEIEQKYGIKGSEAAQQLRALSDYHKQMSEFKEED